MYVLINININIHICLFIQIRQLFIVLHQKKFKRNAVTLSFRIPPVLVKIHCQKLKIQLSKDSSPRAI